MTDAKGGELAGGAIVRQGLDGQSMERRDAAAVAMAERQKALVQARIVQAIQRPRDVFVARDAILRECQRPGFAEKATYSRRIGGDEVTGLSVRFAEAAARIFGNIAVEQAVIHDGPDLRVVQVTATDLERNYSTSVEVVVERTVERRHLREGQQALSERVNSYGERVYCIEANEDEFASKLAAQVSKARRNTVLQILPGDILDEARDTIDATVDQGAKAVDPVARRKKLLDDFSRNLAVTAAQIANYLGHPLDEAAPDEMRDLRGIYNAIAEKSLTWGEVVAAGREAYHDLQAASGKEKRAKAQQKTTEPAPAETAKPQAPDAVPGGAAFDPADREAELLGDMVDGATTIKEMGSIGSQMAKAEKRLGARWAPLLAKYQAKRRTLEDAEAAKKATP